MANHQYFTIPYHLVPNDQSADYTVWYATWSTERPQLPPGAAPPLVICATAHDVPIGATTIGATTKDPPPPPPPPPAAVSMADYQATVASWLQLARDSDE